jgi:hypothetical protein
VFPPEHFAGIYPMDRWVFAAQANCLAMTTGQPVADLLLALPHYFSRPTFIDGLAINVTTNDTNAAARLGVYGIRDPQQRYPYDLRAESVFDAATTGVKSDRNVRLWCEGLAWFVYLAKSGDSTPPSIRALAAGGTACMIGIGATLGATPIAAIQTSYAYANLPGAFPIGGTGYGATNPIPGIAFHVAEVK